MQENDLLDRTVLDDLLESFGGDTGFMGEMLEAFFDDAPRQLEAARAGLATGDAEAVRRAAHSLKSNCATFGAPGLSAQCKELEMLAKTGSLADGNERFTRIAAGYEQVHAALEALRGDSGRSLP